VGIRAAIDLTPFFEKIINMVHAESPRSKFAFNICPESTRDCCRRVLDLEFTLTWTYLSDRTRLRDGGQTLCAGFCHETWTFTTLMTLVAGGVHWMKNVFDPLTHHRAPGRPRMLINDGLATHESADLLEYCFEHNIVLCHPPSHTSHKLQPPDVGMFGTLKTAYRE